MSHTNETSDNANFCRHLAHAAQTIPHELAVAVQKYRFGKAKYTEVDFIGLHQQSDIIAQALISYGVKPGMKTVLMVTPSIEFFALTFALFKAGIIPILVDPGMGIKNLKQCFKEAEPDAFIGIPKAHIARLLFNWGKPSVKKCITVNGDNLIGNLLAKSIGGISLAKMIRRYSTQATPDFESIKLDNTAMAAIMFTSGSTGSPKGVVYSHKMFEAQISALQGDYAIKPGERDLATFPLFSLFGPALGMASIIPDMDASKPIKAKPRHIFEAIDKYQCTNLFANPALIEVLGQAGVDKNNDADVITKQKMHSLKRVISAGAPATLPSIARFSLLLPDNTPVLTSYGASESLPLTKIASQALLKTTDITDNGGGICVGTPVSGVDIKIIAISEDVIPQWSDELALPTNSIGEIVVKGNMVSQAYYHRDMATAHAKITDGNVVRHRMGDLGYLDDKGELWMCGRKAHRVEAKNNVFFSIPCERIFNTHEAIKRTALVGVSLEQNTTSEKQTPLLCVELTEKAKNNKHFDESALFTELKCIAMSNKQTMAISHFLLHDNFPVDIRHNAKIFREKLAIWAQNEIN